MDNKKSVMCPKCGKLLAWVKQNDDTLHKIACRHCHKWIWFKAKSKEFEVRETPDITSVSGKRFY